jgi:protocatechuate 3,4-dioxygenase beta subunit
MKHDHHHHHGLIHDLHAIAMSRRRMLRVLGGVTLVPIIGSCIGADGASDIDGGVAGDANGSGASGSGGGATCATIPQETGGPYPADGTNGANALAMSGIVRSDIRSSLGAASGVASGVVLKVTLTIADVATGCTPLSGRAVYLWHCDRDGNYSLYSPAVASENYLRGVQVTDAAGQVTFTTIYPGCYSGRWPHIHFEVYSSLAAATRGTNAIKTSQLAMPTMSSSEVYASSGYTSSASNFSRISLATDNVFSDGAALETPVISGSVAEGYLLALSAGV